MKSILSCLKACRGQIRYYFLFIAFITPFCAAAQTRGKVEVIKDPLIDTLIARRPTLNKFNNISGEESAMGYRVQIFFGSNRQAAYNAQAKFNEEYPEYRTYITYSEPNFKVHAGDFRTRLEAEKLLKEVSSEFSGLFIFSEKINPPKTEPSND
jgi:hypothetical protein